jgi:transcriptional regulator with XRE-family HTH domain
MSFGQTISRARRQAGLSQKDLAAMVRKEDGTPISPQYLNDLERDRRNPPNEHLLKQFAGVLQIAPEYLFFVAGQYPEDLRHLRDRGYPPERVQAAFRAFRRTLADSAQPGRGPEADSRR